MSDLPKRVHISEEGPREGFQFEKGAIPTARKVELIDALAQTGIDQIQIVSFVNPKAVPGMADAEEVVHGITPRPDVAYTALWLNEKGFERALARRPAHDQGHNPTRRVGKIPDAQPEPHHGAAARRPACDRGDVQGERRAGRARQPHGGVRLQFRGRRAGVTRGLAGRTNPRRGQGARRHADLRHARRHHGLGDAARRSSASSARCASAGPISTSRCTCTTPAAWRSPTPTPASKWA